MRCRARATAWDSQRTGSGRLPACNAPVGSHKAIAPTGRAVIQDKKERRAEPAPPVRHEHERNEVYEAAKKADYQIPMLQAMSMTQLMQLARAEGVEGYAGLAKQELIFQLLRRRVTANGLGWGEG